METQEQIIEMLTEHKAYSTKRWNTLSDLLQSNALPFKEDTDWIKSRMDKTMEMIVGFEKMIETAESKLERLNVERTERLLKAILKDDYYK